MRIEQEISKRDKIRAWVIGIGTILFVVHDQLILKDWVYLPAIGLTIVAVSVVMILGDNKYKNRITLGDKWVWIPLAFLVLWIAVSGIYQITQSPQLNLDVLKEGLSPLLVGLIFFGVYLITRIFGKEILKPFVYATVVASVGQIVVGLITRQPSGGIISLPNYNLGTGMLVFGAIASIFWRQWIIVTTALVGLFFTGAEEALVACLIVGMVVLFRKDFNHRFVIAISVVILVAIIGWGSYTRQIWARTLLHVEGITAETPQQLINDYDPSQNFLQYATDGRMKGVERATSDISLFGHGFNITNFDKGNKQFVHNLPLAIVDQIGVLGAVAWTFVSLYCLIKTRWKYLWVGILSLCVFDVFIWTQTAFWWWIAVGVSTKENIKNDYIFKA